jgi:hypothetical protein
VDARPADIIAFWLCVVQAIIMAVPKKRSPKRHPVSVPDLIGLFLVFAATQ